MNKEDVIFYKGGDKNYLVESKEYTIYRLMISRDCWAIGTSDGYLISTGAEEGRKNNLLIYYSMDDIQNEFETIHQRRKRITDELL